MNDKTLVLVRHGEKMITGEPDPTLSFSGKQQAFALDWKTDVVFVSPLRRALQTYTESHIQTSNVCVRSCFRERMDGISTYFIEEKRPSQRESEEAFCKRVTKAVQHLRQYSGKHLTVISHEDFLYMLQVKLEVVAPKKLATGEALTLILKPST